MQCCGVYYLWEQVGDCFQCYCVIDDVLGFVYYYFGELFFCGGECFVGDGVGFVCEIGDDWCYQFWCYCFEQLGFECGFGYCVGQLCCCVRVDQVGFDVEWCVFFVQVVCQVEV